MTGGKHRSRQGLSFIKIRTQNLIIYLSYRTLSFCSELYVVYVMIEGPFTLDKNLLTFIVFI